MTFKQIYRCLPFLLTACFSFGQKIVETYKPATTSSVYAIDFKSIGQIGDISFGKYTNPNTGSLKIVFTNDAGQEIESYLKATLSGKEVTCEDFFVAGENIIGLFHKIGTKKDATNCIYLQKFDLSLKPVGEPVVITDLKNNFSSLENIDKIRFRDLSIESTIDSKYHLLSFVVEPSEYLFLKSNVADNIAYVFLLNEKGEIINESIYKSENQLCSIDLLPLKIYDDGNAIMSIYEITDDGAGKVMLAKTTDLLLFNNGEISEVEPMGVKYSQIGKLKASSNKNKEGIISYGVSSTVYKSEKVALSLRSIDCNKSTIVSDVIIDFPMPLNYQISDILIKEDNSMVVMFSFLRGFENSGLQIFEIDTEGEVTWSNQIRDCTYAGAYFDADGNTVAIINYDRDDYIKENNLKSKMDSGDEKGPLLPLLITFENGTGVMKRKELKIEGVNNLTINQLMPTGKNGVFYYSSKNPTDKFSGLIDLNLK